MSSPTKTVVDPSQDLLNEAARCPTTGVYVCEVREIARDITASSLATAALVNNSRCNHKHVGLDTHVLRLHEMDADMSGVSGFGVQGMCIR